MWQFTAVDTSSPCHRKFSVIKGLALAFLFAVFITYHSESSSYAQFSATLSVICTDKHPRNRSEMEVLWRSEQQWKEREGMQEDKGRDRVVEEGWCWLDVEGNGNSFKL